MGVEGCGWVWMWWEHGTDVDLLSMIRLASVNNKLS